MTDAAATAVPASSPSVSARMSRQSSRNTQPELALRRLLHAHGYRYRVHWRIPETPRRTVDIAFTRSRVAVFVDGCFWHGCPDHGSLPKANGDWWLRKLTRNQERDAETTKLLEKRGWLVVRVWEHESPERAAAKMVRALRRRS